jgi:hypothetical protein
LIYDRFTSLLHHGVTDRPAKAKLGAEMVGRGKSVPAVCLTVIELHVRIVTFNKAVPFHKQRIRSVYGLLLLLTSKCKCSMDAMPTMFD